MTGYWQIIRKLSLTLNNLLNIELPIIQAPMAGVQGSALTVAVSNAGGLGSLPCAMLSADALRDELTSISAQTSKPYNVNFFCHTPPIADTEREANWRALLAPYYEEMGINTSAVPAGSGREPFSTDTLEFLSKFKPPVVSFHFGLPSQELLAPIKGWGARIISTATTVAEAIWLETHGADAIIAQGLEAGGHRGMFLSDDLATQLGTFTLLPQIVNAVSVPVIAAGGISNARDVESVITLGAAGAQIGTAYLLCPESHTSSIHRAALISDSAQHTALTNLFSGRPARSIINRLISELGPINPAAPAFPLASAAVAPLRAKAESLDCGNFSPLWSGQNSTGCKEIPAAELTRELVEHL